MLPLEINSSPSEFVPSQKNYQTEATERVTTVNGHTIDTLQQSKAFQRSCGCELDRMIAATKEQREILTSEFGVNMRKFAKTMKK